jgi:signal peptidase I
MKDNNPFDDRQAAETARERADQEPEELENYSPVWYSPANPLSFERLDRDQLRRDPAPWSYAAERIPERRGIFELAETLLLAALIFFAVRASFQNFRVEGVSMLPSLQSAQYLIVNKLAYATVDTSMFDWVPLYDAGDQPVHHLFGTPQRGDVVVFRAPENYAPGRDFIKRIIGLPGESVRIDVATGQVFIDEKPLFEPYTQGRTTCGTAIVSCGPWTVPPGHYFVLGDNRQNSSDSRSFGFIAEANIIGKTLLSYWPLEDFGLAPNHSVSSGD